MSFEIKDEDRWKVGKESYETDFTIDKRFHLILPAHLLITVPFTNDRLVLRRLDIDKALGSWNEDYLLVTSTPTLVPAPVRILSTK